MFVSFGFVAPLLFLFALWASGAAGLLSPVGVCTAGCWGSLAKRQAMTGSLSRGHCGSAHRTSRLRGGEQTTMSGGERGDASKPILIFDVMSTLVFDPYLGIPSFLGMTQEELWAVKDTEAWLSFERGECTEDEFLNRFFIDRREWDGKGMVNVLNDQYAWLPGIELLLGKLKKQGYRMHVLSNYPIWWRSIEGKLKLSRYVEWSFISCQEGVRKPDDEIYKIVSQRLGADPESLILVDDSKANVDAAKAMGWNGVLFLDAAKLDRDLALLGVGLEERESEPT